MRDHLKDYWFGYAMAALCLGLLWLITSLLERDQRRINYCYDRGSVLVQTDAGTRCAPLYSLERIRGN